jgi:hypothetical protein
MSDFKTNGRITLRPEDIKGKSYTITTSTSATANDGFIPYGTTVDSVVTVAYDKDDEIVTTDLITGTPTVSDNVINVQYKYPVINLNGQYKIVFTLTLDNSDVYTAIFPRVYAESL